MADTTKIRVMISSRSLSSVFGGTPLAEVRRGLQSYLERIRWYALPAAPQGEAEAAVVGRDQALFDVWIHECDPATTTNATVLEMSLREIDRADIVVVLYTGEAGSADNEGDIGICHAEMQEAISRRGELVVVVELLPLIASDVERDRRFRQYVESQLRVPRRQAGDEASLRQTVAEMLQERIGRLVHTGATNASRKRDRGQALDWNRLDMTARQNEMRKALLHTLQAEPIPSAQGVCVMEIPSGARVAVAVDAIPAALSVAAARERVGQPFMLDHAHSDALEEHDLPGVVHVIACHRGVTETQATRMLGTADVMAVSSDFGVYAVDHVQKIQIVFLAQCGDETAVALAVRKFRDWVVQSGEDSRLLERAWSRRRILSAVAAEQ